MAVEAKRGCGFRRIGGLYLVGGKLSAPCGLLPLELSTCPCCGNGIKQARGWTWINPRQLFAEAKGCSIGGALCAACPMSRADALPEKAGLLWIGAGFYKSPSHFQLEAAAMGISRRLPRNQVPKDLVVGETRVFLAHPAAVQRDGEKRPGIFAMFTPTAVEILITESQSQDPEFMAGIEKRGLTPVVVPDDDPDHAGSVWDAKGTADSGESILH